MAGMLIKCQMWALLQHWEDRINTHPCGKRIFSSLTATGIPYSQTYMYKVMSYPIISLHKAN